MTLALTMALLVVPASAQDLLKDGGFEGGNQSWTVGEALTQHGSFTVETDDRRGGNVAVLENRSAEHTVAVFQAIPVMPAKVYELTGFSRSTKLQEGGGIAVHALDAEGRVVQRRWVHQIPSWGIVGWKEFRAQYTPPKEAVELQVRLSVYKRGQVWFDDLKLVAKDPPEKEDPWGERLTDFGLSVTRFETKTPVYHLDADDLEGDGATEFLIGDVDAAVRCQHADGRLLWERDLGGLALDIDCGDLNGDGMKEVVVCSADARGAIQVFDANGTPGWTHTRPGIVFGHVAVADLDGDDRAEVFATHGNQIVAFSGRGEVLWERDFGGPRMRDVAVGDVTGDGKPNVVTSLKAQSFFGAAFGADGTPLWQFQPVGAGGLSGEDIVVADVDQDGKAEAVMACGAGKVVCVSDGEIKWLAVRGKQQLWPHHRDASMNLGSSMAQIAVADFASDREGLETLVTLVDSAWLLDANGKFLWDTASGLLLLDLVPGPDGAVYVPSSGFRDPSLYKLEVVRGKGNPLADWQQPNDIYDQLDRLAKQVEALPEGRQAERTNAPAGESRSLATDNKFHVVFANLTWPFSRWGSFERLQQTSEFLATKESDDLEFIFMLWPKDLPVELHRGQMSEQDEILRVVRFLEDLGRPFMFFVDHGCSPNLSLDTIEKTLQLAPKTCRGFYVAENTAHYPSPKWDEFVEWAMQVMDLCLEHGGKKMVFKEMYDAWCALPPDPRVRETLLQPKYRDLVVAMYATNNPHAPELQIGGMVGLKQAGLISDWGISTQHWNWSWSAHGLDKDYHSICPADVILRMELSAALLGARWFHIEGGQEYQLRGEDKLHPNAQLHRDLVYGLIRKGLLPPLDDADNLTFSPLVVAREHRPEVDRCREEGQKLGSPIGRPLDPFRRGLFGVNEAVQSVHADYLPALAYGTRRYCDTMFPATPYGYLRIVPECAETRAYLAGKQVLRTDTQSTNSTPAQVWNSGPSQVVADLERAAGELPFAVDGASLYTHRVGDAYRVWALDPGYMWPRGVDSELRIRLPGERFVVRDLVSGEPLPCEGKRVPLSVEAGSFRAVEISPVK